MPEPYFPAHAAPPEGPRGLCGKKNCAAKIHLLGMAPFHVYFGGSGAPEGLADRDLRAGDKVRWAYNNMIAQSPLAGLVVGRLAPDQPSSATMGLAEVDRREVLTVVEVELFMQFDFRRLDRVVTPPDPIRLRLSRVLGPDHFEFIQDAPERWTPRLGPRTLGWQAEKVDVTGPRNLRLLEGPDEHGGKSVLVQEASGLAGLRGGMIWFAHSPEDPEVPLQAGRYSPGQARVTFDPNGFPEGGSIQVEVLSLRDPAHHWSVLRTLRD